MTLRARFISVLLAASVVVVASGAPSFAVHELDLFELDGNVAATDADDWVNVRADGGGSISHVFRADGPATDTTYLHKGDSKDIKDLDEWVRTESDEAPDKDEITNAYAAAYADDDDLIVYFGADRYAQSGSSQIGFWFLQDDVRLTSTGLNGEHVVGDVLILSDFVNGGKVADVDVYRWTGDGGNANIEKISSDDEEVDCPDEDVPDDDLRCGVVNNEAVTVPWSYTPKAGTAGTIPIGGLYEGGLNLTDLFASLELDAPDCLSSFIVETRTSGNALTARLKDFAIGDLDTCAGIDGSKFEDLDADGRWDDDEPGLEGVQMHLFGGEDVHQHTVTDEDGAFEFSDLEPGSYTLCETLDEGWTQSAPSGESTVDCSAHTHDGDVTPAPLGHTITVKPGGDYGGRNFGNWRTASKQGTKFEDENADGTWDRETEDGLEGWTIYADLDEDGTLDEGEPFDVTDSDGAYEIEDLDPGTYLFREVQQRGWFCSYPDPCRWEVTLSSNEDDTGNNFGNWTPASVAGTKFEDADGDGRRDEAEDGLGGWTFYVDYDGDGRLDEDEPSDATDSEGAYLIEGIRPGTYPVREVGQTGWSCTTPDPCFYDETFTSGDDPDGRDFGNVQSASLSGSKWNDEDRDATRDATENGLADWRIHVFGTAGDGSTVDEHLDTAADGTFAITLQPGSYTICETTRGADLWVQSFPQSGADCAAHGGGTGYSVTLRSGETLTGFDFGNYLLEPGIAIDKTASPESGTPGTLITYTMVVTNTGEVPLNDVIVTDPLCESAVTFVGGDENADEVLQLDETWTFTCTRTLGDSSVTNVATVDGTDDIGRTVTDSDDALVFPVLGLVLTGVNTWTVMQTAFGFLGVGFALIAYGRRRALRRPGMR